MSTPTSTWAASCPHCGTQTVHFGPCPNIAAIEYYPNGALKRVEYRDARANIRTQVTEQLAEIVSAEKLQPTKSQRHMEHYRSCGCLDESALCCDPTCCPSPS